MTNSDPYVERVPTDILNCLQFLLVVSGSAVRALWRPRPRLAPLLAEVVALTNLTPEDEEELSECGPSATATAREALLRPARLYNFIAVGLAVHESPLRESPLVSSLKQLGALELAQKSAHMIFTMLEASASGELTDFSADFDPLAPGGVWTDEAAAKRRAKQEADESEEDAEREDAAEDTDEEADEGAQAPTMLVYSVDELRLNRLQLEGLFERATPLLEAAVEADRAIFTPDAGYEPDGADDPESHSYYHDPFLTLEIRPAIRALAVTSLLAGAYWYLDAAVPFALEASRLRWLRRREATLALQQRFLDIVYEKEDDLTEVVSLDFSLAELLTLYQAQESLALAVLNEEILPAIAELPHNKAKRRQQEAAARQADDESAEAEPVSHIDWVQQEMEAGSVLGRLFFRNVPVFAEILTRELEGDEAEDLAAARAEIAALAELATSADAI